MADGATLESGDAIALDRGLSLEDAYAIAEGRRAVSLSGPARARCAAAQDRLARALSERRHIYGITTGFGPLANRLVDAADGVILQQNLVHHLATGLGPPFGWAEARAIVLARLMSILQGASGASQDSIAALVALLDGPFAPSIPMRGTVGASGDLTPLAHMVLCLQGRGDFLTRDGARVDGAAALARMGRAPLTLDRRDGLALVNGTSAMTGVALCSAIRARRLVRWALALTAALAEVLGGRIEAWDPAFAALRPHAGQRDAADALRARLDGAERVVRDPIARRRLDPGTPAPDPEAGQDAYTLRCAPQVIGAVLDALDWHDGVVTTELASVTDNPLFPEDGPAPALHGGNFMGQHVGLVSDSLGTAVCVLAGLMERQIARLTDERLTRDLPAFLHRGQGGLNSGFMGAQVTATATLAEMRTRGPASVQSISTNGANQDVVSMGTIAARGTAQTVDHGFEIAAILGLTVAQAMELRLERDGRAFSASAERVRRWLRLLSDGLEHDRPLAPDIARIASAMRDAAPPA